MSPLMKKLRHKNKDDMSLLPVPPTYPTTPTTAKSSKSSLSLLCNLPVVQLQSIAEYCTMKTVHELRWCNRALRDALHIKWRSHVKTRQPLVYLRMRGSALPSDHLHLLKQEYNALDQKFRYMFATTAIKPDESRVVSMLDIACEVLLATSTTRLTSGPDNHMWRDFRYNVCTLVPQLATMTPTLHLMAEVLISEFSGDSLERITTTIRAYESGACMYSVTASSIRLMYQKLAIRLPNYPKPATQRQVALLKSALSGNVELCYLFLHNIDNLRLAVAALEEESLSYRSIPMFTYVVQLLEMMIVHGDDSGIYRDKQYKLFAIRKLGLLYDGVRTGDPLDDLIGSAPINHVFAQRLYELYLTHADEVVDRQDLEIVRWRLSLRYYAYSKKKWQDDAATAVMHHYCAYDTLASSDIMRHQEIIGLHTHVEWEKKATTLISHMVASHNVTSYTLSAVFIDVVVHYDEFMLQLPTICDIHVRDEMVREIRSGLLWLLEKLEVMKESMQGLYEKIQDGTRRYLGLLAPYIPLTDVLWTLLQEAHSLGLLSHDVDDVWTTTLKLSQELWQSMVSPEKMHINKKYIPPQWHVPGIFSGNAIWDRLPDQLTRHAQQNRSTVETIDIKDLFSEVFNQSINII